MQAGVVIVGGGQAGLEAAAALRTLGYDGTVTLICEEAHAPYQRPPLSKDFLIGKQEADSVFLRALAYYEKHGVDLILGDRVAEINRGARLVHLGGGGTVAYEQLILAVGARNRLLPVPGAENVLYLRSLDEAVTLRQRLAEARQGVVVIGGGFIGLEVAAAGRSAGKAVTVIEAAPRLMARAVSPLLSDFFLDVHRGQGVEVVLNTAVEQVLADAVIVSGGRRVEADVVVAGIGVVPNVELARDAGLDVSDGITVDEFLRTSDPDIFAIGDCAHHPNVFAGGRARLESVQNAVDQAKCVARAIMGNPAPYRDVPWFWTDQYEIRFQMVGLAAGYDESVLRGGIESRKFSVFYFKEGRLRAVDSVNRFGDHIAARKMLAAGTALTPVQAGDESVDLKKLAAQSVG
ncbi:MAG TPA: FAD-dependent oxidoreductase [Bryobacteraceae bacterium]|nr:FAD-dependent oxidoreductase [Bryobacteraceae bacterium]